MAKKALVIVDPQNDFFPGGALAAPDGDLIIKPLNRVIAFAVRQKWDIYVSRDWHPSQTKHFAKWPRHCEQNTRGAEFHPDLHLPADYPNFHVISKGLGDEDDYSAFDGGMLPEAKRLYIGGLATDYCVLWTALKALALGYEAVLLLDACQAVNLTAGDSERAIEKMRAAGAKFATAEEAINEIGE